MTPTAFRDWLRQIIAVNESRIGGPAAPEYAAVVAEMKARCYSLKLFDHASTLPDSEQCKTALTLCNQAQRTLAVLETPTPPVDGGAMSVAQAAGLLGVSKETVYKLCAEGSLPHTRIGTRITITPDQLAEYRQLQGR